MWCDVNVHFYSANLLHFYENVIPSAHMRNLGVSWDSVISLARALTSTSITSGNILTLQWLQHWSVGWWHRKWTTVTASFWDCLPNCFRTSIVSRTWPLDLSHVQADLTTMTLAESCRHCTGCQWSSGSLSRCSCSHTSHSTDSHRHTSRTCCSPTSGWGHWGPQSSACWSSPSSDSQHLVDSRFSVLLHKCGMLYYAIWKNVTVWLS